MTTRTVISALIYVIFLVIIRILGEACVLDRTYPDFLIELLLPLVQPAKALLMALEEQEWLRRSFTDANLVVILDISSRSKLTGR